MKVVSLLPSRCSSLPNSPALPLGLIFYFFLFRIPFFFFSILSCVSLPHFHYFCSSLLFSLSLCFCFRFFFLFFTSFLSFSFLVHHFSFFFFSFIFIFPCSPLSVIQFSCFPVFPLSSSSSYCFLLSLCAISFLH